MKCYLVIAALLACILIVQVECGHRDNHHHHDRHHRDDHHNHHDIFFDSHRHDHRDNVVFVKSAPETIFVREQATEPIFINSAPRSQATFFINEQSRQTQPIVIGSAPRSQETIVIRPEIKTVPVFIRESSHSRPIVIKAGHSHHSHH